MEIQEGGGVFGLGNPGGRGVKKPCHPSGGGGGGGGWWIFSGITHFERLWLAL